MKEIDPETTFIIKEKTGEDRSGLRGRSFSWPRRPTTRRVRARLRARVYLLSFSSRALSPELPQSFQPTPLTVAYASVAGRRMRQPPAAPSASAASSVWRPGTGTSRRACGSTSCPAHRSPRRCRQRPWHRSRRRNRQTRQTPQAWRSPTTQRGWQRVCQTPSPAVSRRRQSRRRSRNIPEVG